MLTTRPLLQRSYKATIRGEASAGRENIPYLGLGESDHYQDLKGDG
jgi:hypothetical protein